MEKRGQSTLEYALIIAVVAAGLVAMQIYMKRGVEGKLRQSADDIGNQYSAGRMAINSTTTHQITKAQETFGLDGDAFDQGVSRSEVLMAGTTTTNTIENLNTPLSGESLFNN